MGVLRNWKVQTKLRALIVFMIAAMGTLGLYNIKTITDIADAGNEIYETNLRSVENVLQAKAAFLSMSTAVYQHITSYYRR